MQISAAQNADENPPIFTPGFGSGEVVFIGSLIVDILFVVMAITLAFIIIWDGRPHSFIRHMKETKLKGVLSAFAIMFAPLSMIIPPFPLSLLDILTAGCLLVIGWNWVGMPSVRENRKSNFIRRTW
jgi:hypothetical protein